MINDTIKLRVLNLIVEQSLRSTSGPTVEELRAELGMRYRSSVQHHINKLRNEGLVENLPRKRRTLRPTENGMKLYALYQDFEREVNNKTI